jgi:integrase
VFTRLIGSPLNIPNLSFKYLKPALERVELPKSISLYDLRDSCVTLLLRAKVNRKAVSDGLGYASITLTLDVYSHAVPDMQKGELEKPGNILFRKVGTQ